MSFNNARLRASRQFATILQIAVTHFRMQGWNDIAGFGETVIKPELSVCAEERIKLKGLRATVIRIRVLAFLLAQQSAVTHHEIEMALQKLPKIDRVTLYRTLDWLTENALIHKVIGADRAWRFRVNDQNPTHARHAHFKCNRCARVVCLVDTDIGHDMPVLPAGYRGQEIELTVRGICANCV
jgi:Fur family transcriptional regulator, ferric uptake regulator